MMTDPIQGAESLVYGQRQTGQTLVVLGKCETNEFAP